MTMFECARRSSASSPSCWPLSRASQSGPRSAIRWSGRRTRSTTRRACSSSAALERRGARADVREPALGRAPRAGSASHREPRVGCVQRAVLRAPGRRAGSPAPPLPARRATARSSTSRSPGTSRRSSRSSASCCSGSASRSRPRWRSRRSFLPPLPSTRPTRSPTAGGCARDRGASRRRCSRSTAGMRWLPLWIAAIALLGFTRDTTWIPIAAVAWCAFRYRSRVTGLAVRDGHRRRAPGARCSSRRRCGTSSRCSSTTPSPPADTSWGFIARHYPGAVRRPRPRERRLPAPRRVVHGALPRRRHPPALPARAAAPERLGPRGHADDGGRRRRRSCTCWRRRCSARSGSSSSSCRWPPTGSRSGSRLATARRGERECPRDAARGVARAAGARPILDRTARCEA